MCVCSCVCERDREATALDGSGAITSLYKSIGPCLLSLCIVSWLVIGEIYPSEVRGRAVSMATSLNWLTNFIVSQTLLDILGNLYT